MGTRGLYCAQHLTDGFITAGVVKMLGGTDDDATTLVFAGLWKSVRGGYRFHDWDGYQQSREEVPSKAPRLPRGSENTARVGRKVPMREVALVTRYMTR